MIKSGAGSRGGGQFSGCYTPATGATPSREVAGDGQELWPVGGPGGAFKPFISVSNIFYWGLSHYKNTIDFVWPIQLPGGGKETFNTTQSCPVLYLKLV